MVEHVISFYKFSNNKTKLFVEQLLKTNLAHMLEVLNN
jgi:hypothetical protein